MKKEEKRKTHTKEELGITLVSLVITIVVLLIFAGVSIATLTGDNGLLSKAQQAKEENEKASDRDKIAMAVSEAQIGENGYQELNETNFKQALENQFKGRQLELIDNGDGSFVINLDNNSKMYYVDSDGEIISNENMLAISTVDELKAFRDDVNNGNTYEGKYVYLTDNITLDIDEEWEPIGKLMDNSLKPYNDLNMRFSGTFNGNGYEINGILINTSDKVQGLFGLVDSGKIINLCIGENNNITGGAATSALVGYLYNGSIVSNCSNKSNIIGAYTGGIVGCAYSNSKILDSYNTGIIEGDGTSGGIAGTITTDSVISGCYNTGNITVKSERAGGIVGESIYNTIVEKCYNCGIISGASFIGGIAGHNAYNSIIRFSYNTNIIKGSTSNIGGIVGKNYENSILKDSYNVGEIIASGNRIGGVIGFNQDSETSNCYSAGLINADGEKIGGVIGDITGENTIKNNYYLDNITYENEIIGVESKTDDEIKELYILLGNSFKKGNETTNNGYPILNWQ